MMRVLVLISVLCAGLMAAACGSEMCDQAVARCASDCPQGTDLQKECSETFEVSTEAACEAALANFVCKVATSSLTAAP